MLWRQVRPRLLWDVQTFDQVTNNRDGVYLLSGANPVEVPDGAVRASFHIVAQTIERNLSAVRVYGSLSNAGFPGSVAAEALWSKTLPIAAGNQGLLRTMAPNTIPATRSRYFQGQLLPRWLLLEFTTAAIFTGAGEVHFNVFATWFGPQIGGWE